MVLPARCNRLAFRYAPCAKAEIKDGRKAAVHHGNHMALGGACARVYHIHSGRKSMVYGGNNDVHRHDARGYIERGASPNGDGYARLLGRKDGQPKRRYHLCDHVFEEQHVIRVQGLLPVVAARVLPVRPTGRLPQRSPSRAISVHADGLVPHVHAHSRRAQPHLHRAYALL